MMTSSRSGIIRKEEESSRSEICVVGRDMTEFNVIRFGSFIRRIDLSFNLLMKLWGLEGCAENLEELILDNNQLTKLDLPKTKFPKLHTISLNKNRIWNLTPVLKELSSKVPNLRYLSLLGNPVCPDQLSDEYVAESEYKNYRCHILFHMPYLRFLDHRIVSVIELTESQKFSYANVKISPAFTPLPSNASTLVTVRNSTTGLTGNNSDSRTESELNERSSSGGEASVQRRKGRQGRRKFKYVGKNSEGNRFIKDSDL